jgi:sugar transferase (PEP-CTERM/EpsH1 system associated)
MADLLYLAHRMPFPPDKGEKIRAYHALICLARSFKIHLGCFADDPEDEKHLPVLQDLCASVRVIPLRRRSGLARGAYALALGSSLSEHYFRDARLSQWVEETVRRARPQSIFVYSSAMAPYAMPYASTHRVILDMVDVDSQKWSAYSVKARWPMNLLYARESRAVLALERRAAIAFENSLFVSRAEAQAFLRLAPETAGRVGYYENGVDLHHFDPAGTFANPFVPGSEPIVFTGTMNYRPNVEAVEWFARQVLPRIRAVRAAAEFWIIGARPAPIVARLAELPGVHVTGRVADVRPYLAHAVCVVAPLHIARGVQNKVLEAMAMAKPVVATPSAREGLSAVDGEDVLIAETPASFADAVTLVLMGGVCGLGLRARRRVEIDYDWSRNLQVLEHLFSDRFSTRTAVRDRRAEPARGGAAS